LVIQFLAFEHNLHEIPRLKEEMKAWGVDSYQIKTAQTYSTEGSSLIPQDKNFSRYREKDNGSLELDKKVANGCWRLWSSPVVTQSGTVIPCCFDKDAVFGMGDLKDQSFEGIWKGDSFSDFREKVFSDRSSTPMCSNCSEGARVFL
jgi:radical SAM protein with 4Fe4S-binding SPASM domain